MSLHVVDIKEGYKECKSLEYCFCAEYNNQICKFKISFDDLDVTNLIEDYMNLIDIYCFEVVPESSLKDNPFYKKFFPYLGKFRLDGSFKSTHNYFAPSFESEMLKIFSSMYHTNILLTVLIHSSIFK